MVAIGCNQIDALFADIESAVDNADLRKIEQFLNFLKRMNSVVMEIFNSISRNQFVCKLELLCVSLHKNRRQQKADNNNEVNDTYRDVRR